MEHVVQRDLGNDAYKTADYDGAVGHYTLAIGSVRAEIFEKPNKGKLKLLLSSYYTSRAAALTKLKQYDEALEDCKCALEFDQNAIKAYQRRARVYMQLGKLDEAIETYDQAFKIDAEAVATDRKHTEQTRDRYESAKAVIEKQRKLPPEDKAIGLDKAKSDLKIILKFCPDWNEARVLEAEALFYVGDQDDAYKLASSLVKDGLSKDRDLLILRARLMLHKGRLDDSAKQLSVLTRRDSVTGRANSLNEKVDLIKTLRDQGEESYNQKDYQKAIRFYSSAIDSCPLAANGMVAKLKFSRSAAFTSLGMHEEAIADYTDIINYDPKHIKAYIRRGSSLMELKTGDRKKNCQLAVKNFTTALDLCHSTNLEEEVSKKLSDAESELRAVKLGSKDYFSILGVSNDVSLSDLYDAYRARSLRIHNFKHAAKTQAETEEAESRLQEVKEAYEVLAEEAKKNAPSDQQFPAVRLLANDDMSLPSLSLPPIPPLPTLRQIEQDPGIGLQGRNSPSLGRNSGSPTSSLNDRESSFNGVHSFRNGGHDLVTQYEMAGQRLGREPLVRHHSLQEIPYYREPPRALHLIEQELPHYRDTLNGRHLSEHILPYYRDPHYHRSELDRSYGSAYNETPYQSSPMPHSSPRLGSLSSSQTPNTASRTLDLGYGAYLMNHRKSMGAIPTEPPRQSIISSTNGDTPSRAAMFDRNFFTSSTNSLELSSRGLPVRNLEAARSAKSIQGGDEYCMVSRPSDYGYGSLVPRQRDNDTPNMPKKAGLRGNFMSASQA